MDAFIRARPRGFLPSIRETPPLVTLSAPVVYSLIIPFMLIDLWTSLYQAVCFPVYGIERVKRRPYIKLDRAKLPYLNAVERLNCLYCSYVNGVIGFVREVAARSEQYWCPIKHAAPPVDSHARYSKFSAYGAADDYVERQDELRQALRPPVQLRTIIQAVRPAQSRESRS